MAMVRLAVVMAMAGFALAACAASDDGYGYNNGYNSQYYPGTSYPTIVPLDAPLTNGIPTNPGSEGGGY